VRKKLWRWTRHTSAYLAVLGLRLVLERIPRRAALKLGDLGGRLAYRLLSTARRRTQEHIKMVLGLGGEELKELSERVFREFGANVVEFLRLRVLLEKGLDGLVRAEGLENLDRALSEGRGAIAITGHLGNWELLGAYLAGKGYPVYVVGRKLFDERIDRFVVGYREMAGVHNVPRGEDARTLLRVLRRGKVLGLLMDQDTKVQGTFVPFLGKVAYTPSGPVKLAMRTGSPIVPMALYREGEGYRLVVLPPIQPPEDVEEGLRMCNEALEHLILTHPEQWAWMHRRWKTRPGGEDAMVRSGDDMSSGLFQGTPRCPVG